MAASKPTAVHYSLIVFVMFFLIASVVAYLQFSEVQTLSAERDKAVKEKNDNERAFRKQLDEIDAIKKLIGHEFDDIGVDDVQNPNKVLGAMRADMARFGGNLQQQTFSATITKLYEELNNIIAERDQLTVTNAQLQDEYLATRKKLSTDVAAVHGQAKDKAEADLRNQIAAKEEAVASKDTEINQLRTDNNKIQTDLREETVIKEKIQKELSGEVTGLSKANDRLRDKLDQATKVSFEKPDGLIRLVDHTSGMVWINLGEVDKLPKRTSFSIYSKDNQGVGRGSEDIKGSIEVTRIIGAHLAEARITGDNLFNPIAPGDPIYTPLWSAGRVESFAFIGLIDLDNDGLSDREVLHDIVTAAGASISSEVDDNAIRVDEYGKKVDTEGKHEDGSDGKLGVRTKFFVIGNIPDPDSTSKPAETEKIKEMIKHRSQMVKETRIQGIRVININDFLSYIGYQPQRRLFIPGQIGRPYNLRNGSQSTATSQTISKSSRSSGNVSGAFTRSKRLKPSGSSGFRSGSGKSGY